MTAQELVRALLDDHQLMHPHHSHLCALCAAAREFLGLRSEVELCEECRLAGPVRLGEIAAHSHGCFRCGKPGSVNEGNTETCEPDLQLLAADGLAYGGAR